MSNFLKKLSTKSSQITQATLSFFDDDQPDRTSPDFWSKADIQIESKKGALSNGHFFYKKSKKKFGELKPVYICLYKHYLIASKTKEWGRKYKSVDLSVHFISFQKLSSSSSSNKYASGITLSYNQKYIELYTKSIEDLNGFLYIFKKYAIQSNFEDMYSLDRRLGSGSYADVYRVKDKLTRRDFAAKFFDIATFKDANRAKIALKNEIIIHRQLEHGNIVKLHEIYETPTHIVLVMELAKGERLIDYVIENAPLSEKESMSIIRELLEAISYLHSLDVIHRDLKLENIMIFKENPDSTRLSIKLLDFGLSVFTNNIELFKRSGTPGYVAPEILTEDTYNTQVDVFSLGVILFTMLSGRSPFVGPDRATVLKLNKKCEFSFKPKYWDRKDLVLKMMEAKPDKRTTAKDALSHRWLGIISGTSLQTTKNTTKGPVHQTSLTPPSSAVSTLKVPEKTIEKSKTTTTETMNKLKPDSAHLLKSPNQPPIRSKSERAPESLGRLNSNRSAPKNSPNLLQIPQSFMRQGSFESEEEKAELEVPYDGMNKGSIRTFYKLNSEFTSAEAVSPRPETNELEGDNSPKNTQDIPSEVPGLMKKLSSLKEADKALKSPFKSRSISYEPQIEELDGEEGSPTYKESCDLSLDFLEESAFSMPRQPTVFKASMRYIKLTSNRRNV